MWFTETPWPPVVGLCVVAVLLFLGWMSQRKSVLLVGAALCIALCGIVFVVEQQIVTERERVEQTLLNFAAAFQRDSIQPGFVNRLPLGPDPDSLSYISATAISVRLLARAALDFVDLPEEVRISDVRTTMSNNDSRAITHFRASATIKAGIDGAGVHHPSRWELTWQRENGEWKIIRATRLNFMTGQPLNNPLTTRE